MNPDDGEELARLETRIRQLRARRSQFKRQMAQNDRRRETQRLCTLGRALISICEQRDDVRQKLVLPFLRNYIARDTDLDVLRGTPFDVSESAVENVEHSYAGHE